MADARGFQAVRPRMTPPSVPLLNKERKKKVKTEFIDRKKPNLLLPLLGGPAAKLLGASLPSRFLEVELPKTSGGLGEGNIRRIDSWPGNFIQYIGSHKLRLLILIKWLSRNKFQKGLYAEYNYTHGIACGLTSCFLNINPELVRDAHFCSFSLPRRQKWQK